MSEIKKAGEKVTDILNEYIDQYEFDSDQGSYIPDEHESLLIADAFYGLISDEDFIKAFMEWQGLVRADGVEVVEQEQTNAVCIHCPVCNEELAVRNDGVVYSGEILREFIK